MSETSSVSATTAQHDDVRAIRELTEAWIAAVRAKDLERLLSMITDDAVFLSASLGPIRGKDMVAALYRESFAKYDIDQTSVFEEIEVTGDWAYAWGTDVLTLTPRDGGAQVRRRGYGLSILQRQADGSWRYRRGINNMAQVSLAAGPQP
jgi:uncharacterized protein (TIGR02246 family)